MNEPTLVAGPYTHAPVSISRTMLLVIAALVPATAFGLYQFGWPAIYLFITTLLAALFAEAICLRLAGKPIRPFLFDGSALLTAWLLAMTLPPWAPWWIAVVGSFFAIIIGTHVFGGIGQNLFNPAMVARVAILISFPYEMTLFIDPVPLFSVKAPDFIESLSITFLQQANFDAVSSATPLGHMKTELSRGMDLSLIKDNSYSLWQMIPGLTSGSFGETSAMLILLGGLFLIYKRIISWHIPFAMLFTLFAMAAIFHLLDSDHYIDPFVHLMSGGAMLGAFFIATDLVTSPVSLRGQILFGIGCGFFTFVIRTWAAYPEGVAFAVLLMNACTPLIDHYIKPRIYGRDRKGNPLNYAEDSVLSGEK